MKYTVSIILLTEGTLHSTINQLLDMAHIPILVLDKDNAFVKELRESSHELSHITRAVLSYNYTEFALA